MNFQDEFTTADKKNKEPEKEKDKTVITVEAYALGKQLDNLSNIIERLRQSIRGMKNG